MVDPELERFKAKINLVELASVYGYKCVQKESSRFSIVMVHPDDGDKIVCATGPDGHSIFFSVRQNSGGGSVIDFVMHREGVGLGGARQILRKCLVEGYLQSHRHVHYRPEVISQDRSGLYARWLGFHPYKENGYLEMRGLNAETIAVFADRIRVDERGNVVFRHDDLRNFSGWEAKNRGFTGFASGGKKALFGCKIGVSEMPLIVITESVIDVMSYYQMWPQPGFYLSFAGAISQDQQELLAWVVNRYPGGRVIVATDNDQPGEEYAELIRQLCSNAERARPTIGKDWNDTLLCREARE